MQRFLRRPEVEKLTGLTRSSIYELMTAGKFPKPVPLTGSKAVGWVESEIINWQKRRIADRDSSARKNAKRPRCAA